MSIDNVFLMHRDVSCACRHFNGYGLYDELHQCRAGIVVSQVLKKVPYRYQFAGERVVYRAPFCSPCFADSDPHGVCECPKREFPQKS